MYVSISCAQSTNSHEKMYLSFYFIMYIKMNSIWTVDLSANGNILTFLEENMGQYPYERQRILKYTAHMYTSLTLKGNIYKF